MQLPFQLRLAMHTSDMTALNMSSQIYLTWTYDPDLKMQGNSDFGPQTDPEYGAEFPEGFFDSLSVEDQFRLLLSLRK